MDDKNTNGKAKETYVCSCCSHYGSAGWRSPLWLRILIGAAIALVIFWLGLKVGEFHDSFGRSVRYGYGRGYPMMMQRGGPGMMGGGYGPGGMRGFGGGGSAAGGTPVPSASSTASTTLR